MQDQVLDPTTQSGMAGSKGLQAGDGCWADASFRALALLTNPCHSEEYLMFAGSEDNLRTVWDSAPEVQRCLWPGHRKRSLMLPWLLGSFSRGDVIPNCAEHPAETESPPLKYSCHLLHFSVGIWFYLCII